ncbi:MAG: carotenoid oxygenase family protein [Myxococcota bacterium]
MNHLRSARVVLDAYRSVSDEHDCELAVVRGQVPEDLRGVLYRNGPGRVRIGDDVYHHPFDGDGMVIRVAFEANAVRYRNRYVRTREFVEESAAGRMRYRAFGTNLPGGLRRNLLRVRFKNAANTSVRFHGGHLLALWEGGVPHTLDPATLATLERFDYGGALRAAAGRSWIEQRITPELPFSAHPRLDPLTGELFNFGTLLGRRNQLLLYRIDSKGTLVETRPIPLDGLAFVHDFVLTQKYFVFFLSAVAFDVLPALAGLVPPAAAIRERPREPAQILVVPRDGGAPVTIEAPPCFVFHHINGYDEGEGRVVVDSLRMDRYPSGHVDFDDPSSLVAFDYPPPRPTRFTLDVHRRAVTERVLTSVPLELPSIHPGRVSRRHRYVYALAASDPNFLTPAMTRIAKLDVDTGEALERELAPDLPSEPVFVPRPDAQREDDGYLLVVVYRADERRSELRVLDAKDLSERTALSLPHHVPPGFHGDFITQ